MPLTRDEKRDKYLREKYGISLAIYRQMLALGGGACWLCRRKPKATSRPLNVDHDHKTGRVRGLLCFMCNHRVLSRGCDKPEIHERAATYLRSDFDGRQMASMSRMMSVLVDSAARRVLAKQPQQPQRPHAAAYGRLRDAAGLSGLYP